MWGPFFAGHYRKLSVFYSKKCRKILKLRWRLIWDVILPLRLKKNSKSQKTDIFKIFENYRFFGQNFVPWNLNIGFMGFYMWEISWWQPFIIPRDIITRTFKFTFLTSEFGDFHVFSKKVRFLEIWPIHMIDGCHYKVTHI